MIATSSAHSWLLIALLLVPLVGSGVLATMKAQRTAKLTALAFTVLEFLLAACMWAEFSASGPRFQLAFSVPWIPDLGVNIAFGVDGIAMVMVLMIAVLTPILVGSSWVEKLPEGRSHSGFFSLLLLLEALTVGVFATTDVFDFYVLFEVMLIPMYFLIGRFGGERRQYAAVKFFLYSFLGGMLMLGAIIGAYAYARETTGHGTFDWLKLTGIVSHAPLHVQVWIFLGFFAAFAIKAPLVPLHTWLPDATTQAPVAAGVMLVGVLDKVGVFGFLRYSIPLTPDAARTLAPLVLTLGVIGVLYGSLLAAGQRDMKRFIAYVSVAHFGFIAIGVFAFTQQSVVGSVTYMVNHSLATGMFLVVIGMLAARGRTAMVDSYGGLQKVTPMLAAMFFIAGLATLSLPGTSSFISEFLVLLGAFPTQPGYIVIGTIGMVLAALYVLWLYQRVFTGSVRGDALVGLAGGPGAAHDPEASAKKSFSDLGGRERWVLIPLVVLIIGLGFYPQPLLDKVGPAVADTLTSVGVQAK